MVNDLGLYRNEDLFDSDLNRELENLIDKSGSAVVLSTSSAAYVIASADRFLITKGSHVSQEKPFKGEYLQ